MNLLVELIQDVQAAGIIIRPDPPDLILKPAGLLTPALEYRVREHKLELLEYLTSDRQSELSDSRKRLEAAGITVAIWEDGSMRVLVSEADTLQAIHDRGTIYSPQDMYMFVTLNERERRMLHAFKRRFGGTTE